MTAAVTPIPRLLIVATAVDLLGGAEKHILAIGRHLSEDRLFEVEVIAPNFLGLQSLEVDHGMKIRRIAVPGAFGKFLGRIAGAAPSAAGPPPRKPSRLAVYWFYLAYMWRMTRAARQADADLVHAHTMLIPGLVARLSGKPYLVTLHGGEMKRLAGPHSLLRGIHRRVLVRSKGVIAVSNELRQQAIALGIPAEKVHYIPNGVDERMWRPGPARPQGPTMTVVCNRRLDPKNGIDVLLEAMRQVDREAPGKVAAVIVGRGPLEAALRAQAQAMGLGNVLFTGFLAEEDMVRTIQDADVAVLPSRMEGLPLAMLEAMAAAKPLVVTRVGGMPDLVDGNGYVIAMDDAEGLAGRILQLARDPDLRLKMGARSREIVEQGYLWGAVANRTAEVLLKGLR